MSQSGGFDLSKLSTASKILLGAGIVYLIDLFLPWQKVDTGFAGCCSASGIEGIGILNILLVLALIAWEVMAIAGVDIKAPRALVSAGLAGGDRPVHAPQDPCRQRSHRYLRLDRAGARRGHRLRRLDALSGTSGRRGHRRR